MEAQRDVPERLRAVRQVLPQVESLAAGVADVAAWVREGDALLDGEAAQLSAGLTAGADGAPSLAAIELLIERHRVRSPYPNTRPLNQKQSLIHFSIALVNALGAELFWRTDRTRLKCMA